MNTCPPLPLTHPSGFVCLLKHRAEKRWTEGQEEKWTSVDLNKGSTQMDWWALQEKGWKRLWGSMASKREEECLQNKVMLGGGWEIRPPAEWIIHRNPFPVGVVCPKSTQIHNSFTLLAIHWVRSQTVAVRLYLVSLARLSHSLHSLPASSLWQGHT